MSVLQAWVENLPIRMQSTLVLGLRGPDGVNCPELKTITRWLRGHTFKPGNPENVKEFMTGNPTKIVDRSPITKEIDTVPFHYFSHLLQSVKVVAYKHPDPVVFNIAIDLMEGLCACLHVEPERKKDFESRLGTVKWPEGQPDNFQEALEQLEGEKECEFQTKKKKRSTFSESGS